MAQRFSISGDGQGDEEAAAIAAVLVLLESEQAAATPAEAERFGWRDSARMLTEGFAPARMPTVARWGRIERLHRAGRGGSGIVGH